MHRSQPPTSPIRHPARVGHADARAIQLGCALFTVILLLASSADASCKAGAVAPTCESMQFSATVVSTVDPVGLFGAVAPTVSGTLTFDRAIADIDPIANIGEYPRAIDCALIDLGSEMLDLNLGALGPNDGSSVRVINDMVDSGGPLTVITDVIAGAISTLSDFVGMFGAGSLGYGYSEFCIQTVTPCPPTIAVDESLPSAPGTIPMSDLFRVQFTNLLGDHAVLDAQLTTLTTAPLVACPEPGVATALSAGLMLLACAGRRRGALRVRTHPRSG